MRARQEVKVGQIWKDNDPRSKTERCLRVLDIVDHVAFCEPVFKVPKAMYDCHPAYFSRQPWVPVPKGRITRISIHRFRPISTGYVLVEDVA